MGREAGRGLASRPDLGGRSGTGGVGTGGIGPGGVGTRGTIGTGGLTAKATFAIIGGPPALSIADALGALLKSKWVAGYLHDLLSRMSPGRLRSVLSWAVCTLTGHPVDVATGRVMTDHVDFQLSGALPLTFKRIYSSGCANRTGPLGHGWSHTLDQAVWTERGKVVYLDVEGRELEFDTFDFPDHLAPAGQAIFEPINRLTLKVLEQRRYEVTDAGGITHEFAPVEGAGSPGVGAARKHWSRLVRIRDRAGHVIQLDYYDRRGCLEWVRDGAGRQVAFEHPLDLGRQRSVTEWVESVSPEEPLPGGIDPADETILDEVAARRRQTALAARPAQGPPPLAAAPALLSPVSAEFGTLEVPITWLFDPETFSPMAKLVGDSRYAISTDHLGTPAAMYAPHGAEVWSASIDTHGNLVDVEGEEHSCPFRWPGQYEDEETGLYYNRFRYYDPHVGEYVAQDPVGLMGGRNLTSYVKDPLTFVDPLGLSQCTVAPPPKNQRDSRARPQAALRNHALATQIRSTECGRSVMPGRFAGSIPAIPGNKLGPSSTTSELDYSRIARWFRWGRQEAAWTPLSPGVDHSIRLAGV